ncbi:mitochondrial carrier [Martensiomyces pterosporus]|nr:mitochondrial carrier [Martensiomyces pterosporus]
MATRQTHTSSSTTAGTAACRRDGSPLSADPARDNNVLLKTSRTAVSRELTSVENAFCGATAGLVSRAVVAPFDVVKITLQLETQRRSYGILQADGVLSCAKRIVGKEGMRGLFKGNLSAEYLYLTYGAVQFLAFGVIEDALSRASGVPKKMRSFVGGALAGAVATTATYPLDLLRTRFVAQEMSSQVYTSILGAVAKIHKEEGLRGFYRGLWPACLQIMPYMGIVFTSYDVLATGYQWMRRNVLTSNAHFLSGLDVVQDAVVGGAAAVIGKTSVYPLDLVRKRLQVQGPQLAKYAHGAIPVYSGMTSALAYIVRQEGLFALFRGLTPALIKAAPASAAVFFVFGRTRDLVLSVREE